MMTKMLGRLRFIAAGGRAGSMIEVLSKQVCSTVDAFRQNGLGGRLLASPLILHPSYRTREHGEDFSRCPIAPARRTIGQYRSPYPKDRERRWIGEAWQHAICEVLAQQMDTPTWFELPATSQLTLTTRTLMDYYQKTCNPFDFLAVAQLAYPRLLRCCEAPRPSCLLYRDRATWAEQPWRCLSCSAPIDPYLSDTEQPIFKSYRRVVASLAHAVELKRLRGDGAEPAPGMMRA